MTHPTIKDAVSQAERRMRISRAIASVLVLGLAVLVAAPMVLGYIAAVRWLFAKAFG